jgi:hypothetical protein
MALPETPNDRLTEVLFEPRGHHSGDRFNGLMTSDRHLPSALRYALDVAAICFQ